MNITRYAMILVCGLLLQGCKILAGTVGCIAASDIPAELPVSITKIQLDPEEPGWHRLEIVSSSKRGYDGFVGSIGIFENISISGVAALCSESDKKLRDAIRVNIYFRNLVGEKNRPSVPEPDGSYLYSALVSVGSEGIRGGGGIDPYEGSTYNLTDLPKNSCSKICGTQMILWDTFGWNVIPKEMIDRALALPPDPQRSAAWRRERAYGNRPTLSSSRTRVKNK